MVTPTGRGKILYAIHYSAVQMVAESKTAEDEQQIYMMDASAFNMHEVAKAVAELNELPD